MIDDSISVMQVNLRKGTFDFCGFNETCPKVFHELFESMPKVVECDGKEQLF